MKIAIDISPLKSGNYLQHRVRGTGFYLENLKRSLLEYYPDNSYTFFTRGEKLPKDIDLAHYPYFEPFFLTLPLLNKYKTVVTVHDLTPFVFPKEFPSGLKGKIKWQIQKLALKNADAVITDSESSKKDIVKYGGIKNSKVSVVYLAAGEEFRRINDKGLMIKEIRKKYNLPEKFILYVGDATWNKNLPSLIEAAFRINVPLAMVGKALIDKEIDAQNPWNKDLVRVRDLAEKNKSVFRLGFVPSDDLVALYNAATLFIMPSIYEGFGLPILEAMNCGCPVITSRSGSIPEIAGGACRYVNAYDADSISQGINEVFNNPNLQKDLSEKGIKQAKKFKWSYAAKETMRVYKGVIEKQ